MHDVNVSLSEPIAAVRQGDESRRLWLVRHGESEWNASGVVQGQLDPCLSESGRAQAVRCARALSAQPKPEAIYSSDLLRSRETAVAISSALGVLVQVDVGLRERSLGDAEGRPSTLLGSDRSGIADGRVVDADAAPLRGESVRQLHERVTGCAAAILSSHVGDVVLVCHGGVVRVLLAWLGGATPDDMAWPDVPNAVPILRTLPPARSRA